MTTYDTLKSRSASFSPDKTHRGAEERFNELKACLKVARGAIASLEYNNACLKHILAEKEFNMNKQKVDSDLVKRDLEVQIDTLVKWSEQAYAALALQEDYSQRLDSLIFFK